MIITFEDTKYKIDFAHDRNFGQGFGGNGRTICTITNLMSGESCMGESFCKDPDAYVKEIGRKRAITRALVAGNFNVKFRTAIWNAYFNRNKNQGVK